MRLSPNRASEGQFHLPLTLSRSRDTTTPAPPFIVGCLLVFSVGCPDETQGTGAGGEGGSGGAGANEFENPAECSEACPSTTNVAGSVTKTLALFAQGEERTFSVDGEETRFLVSAYNGMLPGPTVRLTTPASDPQATENGDFLILDLTNGGGLNTCCHEQCATGPMDPEGCYEPYCKDLGLSDGDPCVQVDTATNIHTHGLHIAAATQTFGAGDACEFTNDDPVEPELPWDNVFIAVPASGHEHTEESCDGADCMASNRQKFMFPLPPQDATNVFQPAPIEVPHWFGLQWYHPHMHEASRGQLGRGLAGAIIIENAAESEIPVLAALGGEGERILLLQALPIDNGATPREHLKLVNGLQNPQMSIRAGETQRWRVLNASSDTTMQLSIVGTNGSATNIPFHPIGFDGIPTPEIFPAIDSDWIHPGSRLELLLSAPPDAAPGDTFEVRWCEPSTDMFHSPTDDLQPEADCTGTTVALATLTVVEGNASPVSFAAGDAFADLASFGLDPDLWSGPADVNRTIRFVQEFSVAGGTDFQIDVGDGNGPRVFEHEQVCAAPIESSLGQIEEWTIENWTTDLHTFHIHVNPFQVDPDSTSAKYADAPFYQDNIVLPLGVSANNPMNPNEASEPGIIKIRIRAKDYIGTSVFHCHLLEHEDHGMMTAITIVP